VTLIIPLSLFCFGAILASFAGVIAERLYTGQSWAKGHSRCDSCARQLSVFDLIPIFSLLVSRGKCRTCHAKISMRHVAGEILLGALFVGGYVMLGLTISLAVFLASLWVLYMLTLYDLWHTVVPPVFSTSLIILSLIFSLLQTPSVGDFVVTLITAAAIALAFFLLYALSGGRAMGLGDTPVAFALSLLIGSRTLSGLVFSFWVGGLIGIAILVTRRKGHRMGIEVPFVPFMAAGYLLAFFTTWNPFAPW
jgi:prepilin signal peptidase PulO-like enzyme (type II secretory pathway)